MYSNGVRSFSRNSVTADLSDCVICEWKVVLLDLWSKARSALSFHRCTLISKCQNCLYTQKPGWIKFIACCLFFRRKLAKRRVSVCRYKFWTIWQRPRGLKRGFAAALLLGLRLRIPSGAWMSVSLSVVCWQVEVTAPGRSLVQGSPIECVWSSATLILCTYSQ